MIVLKNAKELGLMKQAGKITAEALWAGVRACKPGTSTWEIRSMQLQMERAVLSCRMRRESCPQTNNPTPMAQIKAGSSKIPWGTRAAR